MIGPKRTLFMDEISTGLDASTTLQIVRCMRNLTVLRRVHPGTAFGDQLSTCHGALQA